MSPNKNKIKGTTWERDVVNLLNATCESTVWKRIPGSGAIGTVLDMPILKGDVVGKYDFFPFKIMGEAKVGYGGAQMTIHKDWFDKIREEANQNYSLPVVLLKFEKSRSGVKHIIAMDIDAWEYLLLYVKNLKKELDGLYEKGHK